VKINVAILKKKYGPLPVWAWAILLAGVIFLLYRHARNSAGASSSPMTVGTDTAPTAPGDMSSQTPGNAGDVPTTDPGIFDTGGLGGGFSGGGDLGSSIDSGQGSDTSSGNDTGATPGLTHISGDYWWDSDSHKLVKIPGSGGTKKGSGKKKTPKSKHNTGGRQLAKPKSKAAKAARARVHQRQPKNPVANRSSHSPKPITKKKVTPGRQNHTVPLTRTQRAAIDRAHHPTGHPQPIKKTPVRRTVKILPKRPSNRGRG